MSTGPARRIASPRATRPALVAGWAIAAFLALGLSACGGGSGSSDMPPTDSGAVAKNTAPALERVNLPVSQWMGADGQHVLRNSSDWERAWGAHNSAWPVQAAPSLPDINFKDTMLVGVTSSYGGCSGRIAILSAEREQTPAGEAWVVQFQVDVRNSVPAGMLCTTDIKPMADFILLPQSPLPVRFVELPRLQ